MRKKLAIITSHPIQYNAPMFSMLAKSEILDIRVFYTWSQSRESLFDRDFGQTIQWDIPLLEGYSYEFITNVSTRPGPGSYRGIVCPELNDRISVWGAQALIVYGWNYHAHYHAMKYFRGKLPLWFRGDSTLLDETGGPRTLLRRLFLAWIYRHADYALYVGENNRQYFLKHGFRAERLFFAPHAIDNRRFSDPGGEIQGKAENWRREMGIGDHEPVVLFVGKFEPKKDPLLLIEAGLRLNRDDLHFIFTGNGVLENDIRSRILGRRNFHILPFQNQSRMPLVYRLGDLLVLPSRGPGETWGLVVNEAMACGKGVLVSDHCGCATDLVKPGKNGYILRSGDVDHCMELLLKMSASRTLAQEMGQASMEIIEDWSFEAVCRSFEQNIGGRIP